MVRHADALVAWETYPHKDAFTTGQRGANLLLDVVAGKCRSAMALAKVIATSRGWRRASIAATPRAEERDRHAAGHLAISLGRCKSSFPRHLRSLRERRRQRATHHRATGFSAAALLGTSSANSRRAPAAAATLGENRSSTRLG
jgi:hypothetical protein